MTMIGPAPLVGEISKSLGLSLGETTAMTMMIVMIMSFISSVLSGFVVDRIGFVLTWIISLSILIVAGILMKYLSFTIGGLILVRILQGMGMGPINAVISSVCAKWFKYNERTYIAAIQGFSVWLGIALGLVYTPTMFKIFGDWHTALSMSAAPPVIAIIFAVIILLGPKPPVQTVTISIEENQKDFKFAWATSAMYILCLMAVLDTWYQQAFNDMAPGFYSVAAPVGLGLGPLGAGIKLTWAGYASMAGGLVGPFLIERYFKGEPRVPLFIACMLSAMLVLCIRFLSADSGMILVLLPCCILFFSSWVNPTIFGYIAKHYPDGIVGRLGGTATGMASLGAVLGLAAGSTALHLTGFYNVSMAILAVVILTAGISAGFLKRPGIKAGAEYVIKPE